MVISPDGYALTNFHVAQPCGKAMKCGMADGRVYDAVLVGLDPTGDVALIKLFGRDDFPMPNWATAIKSTPATGSSPWAIPSCWPPTSSPP